MIRLNEFYVKDVKIAENGNSYFLSASSLKKEEAFSLYNIVKENKPVKTIEVGLALGASAIAIISAKMDSGINEKHIVLDPFQRDGADNVGLKGISEAGLSDHVVHHEEFSEQYFNKMYEQKNNFDLIFIDGNHTIGQAVTDVFLADKILNANGIIGIHDSLLFSTAASVRYLLVEKKYQIISPKNYSLKRFIRQIIYIRKLGWWYCCNVIPYLNTSLVFLKKGHNA